MQDTAGAGTAACTVADATTGTAIINSNTTLSYNLMNPKPIMEREKLAEWETVGDGGYENGEDTKTFKEVSFNEQYLK